MRYIFTLSILLIGLLGCIDSKVTNISNSVLPMLVASGMGGGTGFEVVAPSGKTYTLTNAHVCNGEATNAELSYQRTIPLHVIEIAKTTDLCLLEGITGHAGLRVSVLAPVAGDSVDIYGFGELLPLTHTSGQWVGKIDHGPMAMLTLLSFPNFVNPIEYTTATILPGNSGSPVLNARGEIIGVAFASGPDINERALIIGLQDIKDFLKPY